MKTKIILDSGAYSSWTRRETINLDEYISYINEYKDILHSYVALDVIPGEFGKPVTDAMVRDSAKQSYDNLQTMLDAGLHPIPVFHQGEDLSWLIRMIDDGEPYIGISPRDDVHTKFQEEWFDNVFTLITNSDGLPIVKTHGFGVTKIKFLLRYPFTTVDSTRWSVDAGFGHMLIPQMSNDGRPWWDKEPSMIAITGIESDANNRIQLEIFDNAKQQRIINYITNNLRTTVKELRENNRPRRKSYLYFYENLCRVIKSDPVRFNHRVGSFMFGNRPDFEAINNTLCVFYATTVNSDDLMNEMDVYTRLVSYYETRELKDGVFSTYVRDGVLKKSTNRKSSKKKLVRPQPTNMGFLKNGVIEPERPPWETDDDQTGVSPK